MIKSLMQMKYHGWKTFDEPITTVGVQVCKKKTENEKNMCSINVEKF